MDFSKWGPLTVLIVALSVLVAVGGLVVVIVEPSTLTFKQYLDELKTFGAALAGLAGAHGLIHVGNNLSHIPPARTIVNPVGVSAALEAGAVSNVMTPFDPGPDEPGDMFDGLPHHPITDPANIPPDNIDLPHDDPARQS